MLKTKKGVQKRFKVTKKGKVVYKPKGKGHLLTGKDSARLRRLRRDAKLKLAKHEKFVKKMLPYA